jgi:23S rRNA pseudouridine1911/1915/1917 synthase
VTNRFEADATAAAEHEGMRADRFAADVMRLFTRSQMRQRDARITVNDEPAKPSRTLHAGDAVRVSYLEIAAPSVQAEPMDLDIVYEDTNVVVVNKPAGVVVHPAAGNWTGTLAQGLMHHVEKLVEDRDSLRPGIVHRLDKDTSGILITAKSPESQEFLAAQFRARTTDKLYLAVVRGSPPRTRGTITTGIARDSRNRKRFAVSKDGGREAETAYRVLKRYPGYSFLAVRPRTGRTHQIRVHARHMRCPIVGDTVYGRKDRLFPDTGLMLHAYRLSIILPGAGGSTTFTAPLPERFRRVLKALAGLPSEGSSVPPPR